MSAELFQQMAQSIIDGDSEAAAKLAQQAIDTGVDADAGFDHARLARVFAGP